MSEAFIVAAAVDWTQITQMVVGVLTLGLTTLGAGWALYIGYRQKQIEAKLELARLEAEQAKIEAAGSRQEAQKQGRRLNRKAKQLDAKQDKQSTILSETQAQIEKLEKNTNGMQERLLKEEAERGRREGHSEGHAKGTAEGVEKAKELVKEAAIEAVKQVLPTQPSGEPTQVVVMNQADHPVPVSEK